jgi:hypothetical protein
MLRHAILNILGGDHSIPRLERSQKELGLYARFAQVKGDEPSVHRCLVGPLAGDSGIHALCHRAVSNDHPGVGGQVRGRFG